MGESMTKQRTFACGVALLTGLAITGCSNWTTYAPGSRGLPNSADMTVAAATSGAPKSPSSFTDYLATEYVALATSLSQQGDIADTDYFARKALAAEQGQMVAPENNANWAIPLEQPYGFRTQLTQARTRLVAALDGGARDRAPALAAKAQARYDCWTERMEDDWQHAQNGPCRADFLAAMDQLEAKPAAAPPPAPGQVIDVYFDFNKASLSREARQIVEQIAGQLKANGTATVTIVGKTDLSGSDSYNLALSKRRAEAVRAALVRDGIAAGRITTQWTGEREPPVKTGQGVREPRNRVVEVTIR
jgi:OOP family OmpA-OmpF porin